MAGISAASCATTSSTTTRFIPENVKQLVHRALQLARSEPAGPVYLVGAREALWVQRRYGTPALTVIYDNRGWAGPKFSTLMVYPDGAAARTDDFHVSLEPD
jgi:thiamine pyrophosphate-dependent acetolactate synthase large subunit-like protein